MRAALRAIVITIALSAIAHADRPDKTNGNEPFKFATGEVVMTHDSPSGHFRIHYTTTPGANDVPTADGDSTGVPDRVEELAVIYDEVEAFYLQRGFRAVLPDSDDVFDVYLVDFGRSADGAYRRESCDADNHCSGFIVQENDFSGYGYPSRTYADRVLASHEYFHAVQAAYDNSETTILVEGSAVWATEQFDATLDDFEGFIDGYLDRPDRSLYLPQNMPVDPFSYGAAIFFQFLSERFDAAIIEELWVASDGPTDWFAALPSVLTARGSSFPSAFAEFANWNLYTGAFADATSAYAHGVDYPAVKLDDDVLPVDRAEERVFPSSTLYIAVPPAGRARVGVQLVHKMGVDGTPLQLSIARRTGSTIAAPVPAPAPGTALVVDVAGADELIVLLVNVATSGESIRPAVCIGDETELAACAAKYGVTPPPGNDDGGCRVAGASSSAPTLVLALAALLVARRRVRQSS